MIKITSPDVRAEGTSVYGGLELTFEKGVATIEDVSESLEAYLLGAGYEVEGRKPSKDETDAKAAAAAKQAEAKAAKDAADAEEAKAATASGTEVKGAKAPAGKAAAK